MSQHPQFRTYTAPSGVRMVATTVIAAPTPTGPTAIRGVANSLRSGLEVHYSCGCVWEFEPRAFVHAAAATKVFGLPDECPNHSQAVSAQTVGAVLQRIAAPRSPVHRAKATARVSRELELSFDTEPIVGWRLWKVRSFERRGGVTERRLEPLVVGPAWTPGVRAEAHCNPPHFHSMGAGLHEAPWPTCSCGLWAIRSREAAMRLAGDGYPYATVLGEVALWGRVLQFERGYRAQYAYPKTLEVLRGDEELASELERLYRVPVKVAADRRESPAADEGKLTVGLSSPGMPISFTGWSSFPSFSVLTPFAAAEEEQRTPLLLRVMPPAWYLAMLVPLAAADFLVTGALRLSIAVVTLLVVARQVAALAYGRWRR